MAIHVHFLFGLINEKGKSTKKSKKLKRVNKLEELVNIVSAVRNSNSGYVIIHFVGLAEDDYYTGKFNEFADYKLKELILDGSLFTDVYKKTPLSKYAEYETTDDDLKTKLEGFKDFLVLYIEGSESLVTSNFHTKHPLDDGILDATHNTVFKLLKDKKQFTEEFPPERKNLKEILSLQESRSVQLKGYDPTKDSEVLNADILFQNRLAEYISAFTKCDEGGSFFFAVKEKPYQHSGTDYESRVLEAQRVLVKDQDKSAQDIKDRLRDCILVCDYDGTVLPGTDIVRVYFVSISDTEGDTSDRRDRPVPGSSAENCVLCVQARPVCGIVFCDKEGPLAYKVTDGGDSIIGYSFEDWIKVYKTLSECKV